jgi:hypothetical protein
MVEECNEKFLEKQLENLKKSHYPGVKVRKTVVILFMIGWRSEPKSSDAQRCHFERTRYKKYDELYLRTTPKEIDELFNKIHTSFSLLDLLKVATKYINTFRKTNYTTSWDEESQWIVQNAYIPYLYDLLSVESKQQCDKIEKQQLEINKLNKRLIRLEKKQKDTDDWIEDIEDELENKPKVNVHNLLDI